VSGVEDDTVFPDLDSAFAAMDEELWLTGKEEYVPLPPPDWIIVLFQCGGINLCGLVDTGSEINLIAEHAV
jgi:hypothetical protein